MEAVRHNEKYHNYTVSDEELALMLVEAMTETTFLGVTVSVKTVFKLDKNWTIFCHIVKALVRENQKLLLFF